MLIPTRGVEFSFNNQMYKQLDGVAMGSPVSPALANIFVGFHESRLFDNTVQPGVYLRFNFFFRIQNAPNIQTILFGSLGKPDRPII